MAKSLSRPPATTFRSMGGVAESADAPALGAGGPPPVEGNGPCGSIPRRPHALGVLYRSMGSTSSQIISTCDWLAIQESFAFCLPDCEGCTRTIIHLAGVVAERKLIHVAVKMAF